MLRRSFLRSWMRASPVALQGWGSGSAGWGSSDSGSAGGGWGSSSGTSGGGGWGSAGDAGSGSGWGSEPAKTSGGGGWGGGGGERRTRSSGGDGGGWGSKGDFGGGGGGWGGDGGGGGGWGGDAGWRSGGGRGSRDRNTRGSFRRGRRGGGGGGDGGGRGVWGEAVAGDEEAWNAAPPSFQPPVRRVDPLSLTAVEVEVDGVKKLVGQRVQVSGLSDETSWQTLKDHLRQTGDVTFCRTFSGGRGMVEFATPEEAARCITELQASELEGATLYLREDREDTVLINTRRKIRNAREAQLRARKEEAEKARRAQAVAEGDSPEPPTAA